MKLKKLTKIEEDVIGHLGGILSALFGPRFSVDFSPLFGLRAFGKLLVLLYFSSFGLDLWALFGPLLDRTFRHAWAAVFTSWRFLSLRYSSSKEWPGLSCLVCLVAVFIVRDG
jgi:hypothetical protein